MEASLNNFFIDTAAAIGGTEIGKLQSKSMNLRILPS